MKAWLYQHQQALKRALERLRSTLGTSLLAALVLGIALAIPGMGQTLVSNLSQLAGGLPAQPQISIFMQVDASPRDVAEIRTRLQKHPQVRSSEFVSREDALKRLRSDEGMAEVVEALPRNPLPDAFIVESKTAMAADLEGMRETFARYPKVDVVQLDSQWVKRLEVLIRIARLGVMLMAGVFGVALLVITFNTIRLQILTQQDEIAVSRLLGATDGFIHRPFLYFGALQGLAGGAIAWLLVIGLVYLARAPLADLASGWGLDFNLRPAGLVDTLVLLGFSAALGWLGAWLSVRSNIGRVA